MSGNVIRKGNGTWLSKPEKKLEFGCTQLYMLTFHLPCLLLMESLSESKNQPNFTGKKIQS
jgi:hypothetical protein